MRPRGGIRIISHHLRWTPANSRQLASATQGNLAPSIVGAETPIPPNLRLALAKSYVDPLHRGDSENGDNSHSDYAKFIAQCRYSKLDPNLMTYLHNLDILEACKAGDTQTGWRIYDKLRKSSSRPDAYTYSILLNAAKKRSDKYAIDQIVSDARDDGTLMKSPFIVADLLHAIYLSERKRRNGAVFAAMMSTYQLYFDVQPLKDLGLLPDQFYQAPSTSLMLPPPPPLGMMIIAFLVQFEGHRALPRLYASYRNLVEQAHPVISPLAMTDHTSNAYLMALGRRLRTLPLCTSVVEDMLRSFQSTVKLPSEGAVAQYATPTVITWSILLASFLRQRQRLAAGKVMRMMHKRGLKPNHITYNTLISGHARMQDAEGAVSALRSMENAGITANRRTMEALGWIHDRRRLLSALEKAEQEEEAGEAEVDDPSELEQ